MTFMLHPINLFVTKDAQSQITYRGVQEWNCHASGNQVEFLRRPSAMQSLFLGTGISWSSIKYTQVEVANFLGDQ